MSRFNKYFKCFFQGSSNAFLENQYVLQYISVEIIEETRNEVLKKMQMARKFFYIKNFDSKQTTKVLAERRKNMMQTEIQLWN